jgi:RNA polymerase sigma-70 factor (ECF subfamily)
LRELEPGQRALLALYYLEGLSVAGIAPVLEIPAGTVKLRLFNARK